MGAGTGLTVATAVVAVGLGLAGCGGSSSADTAVGDPVRGHEQFEAYNCGSCHRVSSMDSAGGRAGPALDDLAEQRMIAGVLPMTPEFLAEWIQDPTAHSPDTGMPDLDVDERDAKDIAAWLLSR